ncbi:MAG: GTPase [Sulfurimonas sp.]|jgi:small GTP-binding protein|uniref:YcjF family protein n=1 Tax=Sulfurimonas sp. TaxID=2022749 RepID=UPI003564892C
MSERQMTVEQLVFEELKKVKAEFSNANILVAGKTGVGKSTLINAVFHGELAKTGLGKPITQNIEKYSKFGIPINIYDTKGLEMEHYKETLHQVTEHIEKLRAMDAEEHIHLAWICVAESSARFEDGEKNLIELLNEYNIPVVIVLTKASKKNPPFKEELHKLIGNKVKDIVAISATGEELEDDDGNIITSKPKGLKDLISISYYLIPEGKQLAFVTAQKISLELKKEKVATIIKLASATAAAAATSPIPFSDSAIIIPIQVGMIVKITMTYGIPLEKGAITALASSVVGCTAATTVGRSIVGNLLKLVPGLGTVAGDVINASVAGVLTTGLGELYNKIILEVYSEALNNNSTEISIDDIINKMAHEWKNK